MFDTIPKGVQMVLVNLVKQAAPQIAEQIDNLAMVAKDVQERLIRIEAKLDEKEKHYAGSGKQFTIENDGNRIPENSGTIQRAPNGAGKPEIDD